MKRVFLIHGWDSRPDNHWFPWLKRELEARYFKVYAPAMPHADHPHLEEWLSFIKEWVGKPDGETFFVGHSLGCIAILRYLETLPENKMIGGAVFVGGFSSNINIPELAEFYATPIDVSKVRRFGERSLSILSDNDEMIPLEKGIEFSDLLRAKTIILHGKGHFRKSDGVISLPEVLQIFES